MKWSTEAAPKPLACPAEVPAGARCLSGQDSAGLHDVIVVPAARSGVLVLHAHGGPTLGAPKFQRALEDLWRSGIWVRDGQSWGADGKPPYPLWMGRPVFGNIGARYRGSPDDAALNAAVLRYRADAQAVAAFGADTDPNGHIPVPALTVHAVHDPMAFVELHSHFRSTMAAADAAERLVRTYSDDREHSCLCGPVCPSLTQALLAGCRFPPDYEPAPLDSRVTPRQRP